MPTTSYYRNKDLKNIFGLSDNTILKYRETGIIPYTRLDNIYYYPKQDFDEVLKSNSNWELFIKKDDKPKKRSRRKFSKNLVKKTLIK